MQYLPLVLMLVHAAQSAPVSLVIGPAGKFDVSYRLSTGPSATATIQITGDLAADVEMTDGVISRFRFAGANVAYSNVTTDIILYTFPAPAKVRLIGRNIVSNLTSNSSSGAIDPLSGIISNTGHRLIQNRGTLTTRYLAGSILLQEDIRDLSKEPDSNPLVGVTTVTRSLLEDLDYKARYRFGFSHTREEIRTQPAEVVGGTVTIAEVGGFSANGEAWLPGPLFVDWSLSERNQRPQSMSDRDTTTGQPLVLLYAFNAPAGTWVAPVTFDRSQGSITLELPHNGLKAPVRLEFSPSLSEPAWKPLTKDDQSPSVFNIAESGPVTMDLPPGNQGFVRLSLAD